jgi:HPt (histidine-containing phosphotransfer) domain-containing protein
MILAILAPSMASLQDAASASQLADASGKTAINRILLGIPLDCVTHSMRIRLFEDRANNFTLFGALCGLTLPLLAFILAAHDVVRTDHSSLGPLATDLLTWATVLAPLWLALLARGLSVWKRQALYAPDVPLLSVQPPSPWSLDTLPASPRLPVSVDLHLLHRFRMMIARDDTAFFLELIADYQQDLLDRLEHLRQATAALDVETVRRMAHTMKSSSQMFGALHLAAICERIEYGTEVTANDLDQLEAAVASVNTFLAAFSADQRAVTATQ